MYDVYNTMTNLVHKNVIQGYYKVKLHNVKNNHLYYVRILVKFL